MIGTYFYSWFGITKLLPYHYIIIILSFSASDDIAGEPCIDEHAADNVIREPAARDVYNLQEFEVAQLLLDLNSSSREMNNNVRVHTECIEVPTYDPDRLLNSIRTEKQLTSLSGINTFKGFDALCDAVSLYEECDDTEKIAHNLTVRSRVLMTLMKLKLALSFVAMSVFFDTTRQILSREFKYTIRSMRFVLDSCIVWPSRKSIDANMPSCFAVFTSTRVILDCTEVPVFTWKCLKCRNQTYSHYKGRHTLKFMVGIAPCGLLTFVSDVYGGKASDKFIFNDCGIVELLESRDGVMVDRGFFIEEECAEKDVRIIRPSFMPRGESQLPVHEAEYSREVARARVHVERCIERLKNFDIFHKEVPNHLIDVIPDVVHVICGLYNLASPILSDERF
jgi:hypothetical protein